MTENFLQLSPRVLIVEDNAPQARAMEFLLKSVSAELAETFDALPFKIDKAMSVHGALNHLTQPAPAYDICLLDLSLPLRDGAGGEEPRAGYEILKHIVATDAIKRVIIVSVFSEYKYVIEALRSGAFDFISKPYEEDTLRAQVINSFRRLLEDESRRVFDQRVRSLVPHAERGLARNFTAGLSPFFTVIKAATDDIKSRLSKRYGVDYEQDRQHDMVAPLHEIEAAAGNARDHLALFQSSLSEGEKEGQSVELRGLLSQISQRLLPCLAVKQARLSIAPIEGASQLDGFHATMFQDDISVVIGEMISGGLSQLAEYGTRHKIQISVERHGKRDLIRFEDDMKPISKEDAEAINKGYRILSDPEFKRVWGLSIAQHVAMSSGGYLEIVPGEWGNVITYNISLRHHG